MFVAGAFLNFFNNVWEQKGTTELILHGVKKRRKEPLPELPKGQQREDSVMQNGSLIEDNSDLYTEIKILSDHAPDSPYVEVALRNSFIDSDSYPSSPDHTQAVKDKHRSRASTCDSREFNNDVEGLYAKVDKRQKFSYIKGVDKHSSDDLDDEDEMIWQENAAYDSNGNFGEDAHPPISHLKSATISDSPYATVPFTPKSHKNMVKDHAKFATLPHNWSKGREPTYETIEQIKASIIAKRDMGFDNDNVSSVSSKSKDSIGSLLDLDERVAKEQKKSPGQTAKWYMSDIKNKENAEKTAPIAKPEVCIFHLLPPPVYVSNPL